MNPITISGFKAYDLRGRIPSELNEDVAYRIGRAYAEFVKPKKVIVGRDIRLSSEELAKALEQGLLDSGVDVYDIGLCGTEVVYFATFAKEMDGGIMVTASHNPPDYNGMKFVREGSRPISGDNGLQDIRRIAEAGRFSTPARVGERGRGLFQESQVPDAGFVRYGHEDNLPALLGLADDLDLDAP